MIERVTCSNLQRRNRKRVSPCDGRQRLTVIGESCIARGVLLGDYSGISMWYYVVQIENEVHTQGRIDPPYPHPASPHWFFSTPNSHSY